MLRSSHALATLATLAFACGGSSLPRKGADPETRAAAPETAPSASVPAPARARCPTNAQRALDVAITEAGAVRGKRSGDVTAFLGVPYAAPPVGARRWEPPAQAPCFEGVRDATSPGPGCVRVGTSGKPMGGAEDCLHANVWTPRRALGDAPRPVLVWMHGGVFVQGTASDWDGAWLAEHGDLVVVAFDHRLGALGSLAHPALPHAANLALRDALAALAWVKRNAEAFGGDPSRVTAMGEGSGGTVLAALLASGEADALVTRAVLDGADLEVRDRASAEAASRALAEKLGCADAACLRAKDAQTIASAVDPMDDRGPRFGVAVDGDLVKDARPLEASPSRVPWIGGAGAEDAATQLFAVYGRSPVANEMEFALGARKWIGAEATERVMKAYLPSNFASAQQALVALASDRLRACPLRRALRASKAPAWRFVYAHTDATGLDRQYGAARGLELKYLFHQLGAYVPSAAEEAMSRAMIDAVARFASAGDPGPDWPRWDAATDPYRVFDAPPGLASGFHAAGCDALDAARAR